MRLLKFQDFLFELGDANARGYDWKIDGYKPHGHGSMAFNYSFNTDDLHYIVSFVQCGGDMYDLMFGIGKDYEIVTNRGNQFKIMATIVDIIFSFVDEHEPDQIIFTGSNQGEKDFRVVSQRTKFYREYVKKNMPDEYEMILNDNNTIIQKK